MPTLKTLFTFRNLERKVQDAAGFHFEETEKEKERKDKKKASAMEQFNNRGVSRCETSINSVRSVKISVIFDMMFWLFGFRMTGWNFEDFWLPRRHFEGPEHQSAGLRFGQIYREIGSNLDTGILQGNRLQFGYRNPASKVSIFETF
ncbi:hypothetical protein GLOIN_2v1761212 [Rhizophagus irregularis DAOM 181602=DAOM 197198]|uniref:Uncharacterized protein n=1 Tax=Rhizophagus irregularis (strain DAOM 181602 / DAOM 197198 / MUCL 43194) TaxID=747089 RepID=A0A2P4QZW1_RHIID|nr:hypothetical protein GLOIN_2v1761212 [Rhizophagus irregularis DAOM 181602=DAOM 197198]POG83184.1 hypothetical protein GLOIN_2v1761212 [Rhizophagus irregularis DAOM 181602=DAOM 197198]|eukprot:XP_025190050.1 hypothetical protein GLOIN_2v1761212 [Rhizophagus irregularis DAOM 181602=DAOM 197198]